MPDVTDAPASGALVNGVCSACGLNAWAFANMVESLRADLARVKKEREDVVSAFKEYMPGYSPPGPSDLWLAFQAGWRRARLDAAPAEARE